MVRTSSAAALLAAGLLAAGCAQMDPNLAPRHNPSLYSVHQPVVQRTDFVLDVLAQGGGLPASESERLRGWFDSLGLGYGDRISVEVPGGAATAVRNDVAAVAASYGLLLTDGAPIMPGTVQPGYARVIVSRMTASVPGCPDWAYAQLPNAPITTDSNYGCAVNSNIAAMVADPNDLVLGQQGASAKDAATATKAIRVYRDAPPSGTGGLKAESPGGN